MFKEIKLLFTNRALIKELVKKGIRLKYRNSFLGIIWSLFEPVLSITIMVIVFGTLFGHKEPEFILYVACGRLLFSFFQEGTLSACNSVRNNAELIKKVYIPNLFFPISEILWRFIVFLISLIVLVLLIIIFRIKITVNIFLAFIALALLFILTLSMGIILSIVNVYFRDVEFLWKVITTIIMYLSAVFYYPNAILASNWGFLLKYNPFFSILQLFRVGVSCAEFSPWFIWYPLIFSILLSALSLLFYYFNHRKLILYV